MRKPARPGVIILLMGMFGLCVAAVEYILYYQGVGVDALAVCGLTLEGLMTITIVITLIWGAILAAVFA